MTINVGNYIVNGTTYPNRALSASYGGEGIESDIIPWANTNHNPWDYKYEDDTFVLDVLPAPVSHAIPEPTLESRLDDIEVALCELYEALL